MVLLLPVLYLHASREGRADSGEAAARAVVLRARAAAAVVELFGSGVHELVERAAVFGGLLQAGGFARPAEGATEAAGLGHHPHEVADALELVRVVGGGELHEESADLVVAVLECEETLAHLGAVEDVVLLVVVGPLCFQVTRDLLGEAAVVGPGKLAAGHGCILLELRGPWPAMGTRRSAVATGSIQRITMY